MILVKKCFYLHNHILIYYNIVYIFEVNHCGDWSDEFNCTRKDGNSTTFLCRDGSLVSFYGRCDGFNSCGEWEDEEGCRTEDGNPTIFHCFNQNIISFRKKCDNIDHCGDNSDEVNCLTPAKLVPFLRPCQPFQFTCKLTANASRRCIPYEKRCDSKYQCGHGEDEEGCGNQLSRSHCWGRLACRMHPPYVGICPPTPFMCDNVEQCLDGSDEKDCPITTTIPTITTTTTMSPFERYLLH